MNTFSLVFRPVFFSFRHFHFSAWLAEITKEREVTGQTAVKGEKRRGNWWWVSGVWPWEYLLTGVRYTWFFLRWLGNRASIVACPCVWAHIRAGFWGQGVDQWGEYINSNRYSIVCIVAHFQNTVTATTFILVCPWSLACVRSTSVC